MARLVSQVLAHFDNTIDQRHAYSQDELSVAATTADLSEVTGSFTDFWDFQNTGLTKKVTGHEPPPPVPTPAPADPDAEKEAAVAAQREVEAAAAARREKEREAAAAKQREKERLTDAWTAAQAKVSEATSARDALRTKVLPGTLIVNVKNALNLLDTDVFDKSDPYCVVHVWSQAAASSGHDGADAVRTRDEAQDNRCSASPDNLDPEFGAQFRFDVADAAECYFALEVMDKDIVTSDDSLGSTGIQSLWKILTNLDDHDPYTADTADDWTTSHLRQGLGAKQQGKLVWNYEWLPVRALEYERALEHLKTNMDRLEDIAKAMRAFGADFGDLFKKA